MAGSAGDVARPGGGVSRRRAPRRRRRRERANGDPLEYEGRVALDQACFVADVANVSRRLPLAGQPGPMESLLGAGSLVATEITGTCPFVLYDNNSRWSRGAGRWHDGGWLLAPGRHRRGARRTPSAPTVPELTDEAAAESRPPKSRERNRRSRTATGEPSSRRWSSPATSTSASPRRRATARASTPPTPAPRSTTFRSVRAGGQLARRGRIHDAGFAPGGTPRFVNGFLPRSVGIGGTPSFLLNTASVDFRYTSPELPVMVFSRLQLVPRLEGTGEPTRLFLEQAFGRIAPMKSAELAISVGKFDSVFGIEYLKTRRTSGSGSPHRCSPATRRGHPSASKRSTT